MSVFGGIFPQNALDCVTAEGKGNLKTAIENATYMQNVTLRAVQAFLYYVTG